jgi:3-oxoacyl-[acyl-carrier protein] reductase
MAFSLTGRTALVTGASRGIGRAIAERLAEQGAKVVLAARTQAALDEVAAGIRERGGVATTVALDLASAGTIHEQISAIDADFAEIDILVNNAGITDDGLIARMTLESWEKVIDTNLTGAFAVTKFVLRGMMRRRFGRVISVSSVVGLMGNAGQANYAAAKAGLIGFSKSVARELGSRGITVNVVAPGYIETAMTDALPEKARTELASSIALGRLGQVDDIAWPVLFLASDEAGYITGQTINVSGGLYI